MLILRFNRNLYSTSKGIMKVVLRIIYKIKNYIIQFIYSSTIFQREYTNLDSCCPSTDEYTVTKLLSLMLI